CTTAFTRPPSRRDDSCLLTQTEKQRDHLVALGVRQKLPKGMLDLLVRVGSRVNDLKHTRVGGSNDLFKARLVVRSSFLQLAESICRHPIVRDKVEQLERAQRPVRVGV